MPWEQVPISSGSFLFHLRQRHLHLSHTRLCGAAIPVDTSSTYELSGHVPAFAVTNKAAIICARAFSFVGGVYLECNPKGGLPKSKNIYFLLVSNAPPPGSTSLCSHQQHIESTFESYPTTSPTECAVMLSDYLPI